MASGGLNMKINKHATFLKEEFLLMNQGFTISLEKDRGVHFLGVAFGGQEFNIYECEGDKFFVECNNLDVDVEDNRSVKEILEEIFEIEEGKIEVNRPTQYYGGYRDTLQEAIDLAKFMAKNPVSEWPKEYKKPKFD